MTEPGKTHWAFSYSLVSLLDFINIMLHYSLFTWKSNCYCSFTDVFIAVATNIRYKVSFNIKYYKNFLVSLQYYLLFLEHYKPFTPWHQYEYSPYFSQQISSCAGRENLFNNQEALQFIIIAFILITLMFDSGVILKGEIRC